MIRPNVFDGPIPGANFTSDERNWPWHRAPDITDTDEALDYIAAQFAETSRGFRYLNFLETGVPITTVVDMVLTLGIGNGKWTPDFALLLAGPTARLIEIMAKGYGVAYDLGIDEPNLEPTAEFFKEQSRISAAIEEELETPAEEEQEAPEEMGGLMSASRAEEQQIMLGQSSDETDVEGQADE